MLRLVLGEVVVAIIIQGKTECSICSNVIEAGDDIIATSHFIKNEQDPLWPFSDSAMHRSCFIAWDHRAEFVARFNRTFEEITFGNGTYKHMESNGDISVRTRNR